MKTKRALMAGLVLAAGVAALGIQPAQATSLQSRNLADLVRSSNQIVVGTVAEVDSGRQGNLPFIEVSISVRETLMGEAGRMLTFRQLGMPAATEPVDGRLSLGLVPALPTYTEGEEVVLFLGPVTPSGYRATVGLQQGKFSLYGNGIQNGAGNMGLFASVAVPDAVAVSDALAAMLATREGAVNSKTFLDTVRRAVAENWWK